MSAALSFSYGLKLMVPASAGTFICEEGLARLTIDDDHEFWQPSRLVTEENLRKPGEPCRIAR